MEIKNWNLGSLLKEPIEDFNKLYKNKKKTNIFFNIFNNNINNINIINKNINNVDNNINNNIYNINNINNKFWIY